MANIDSALERNPNYRIQKAIQEMHRRGVEDDRCPRCKHLDWKVDIVKVPASSEVGWQPLVTQSVYAYTPTSTGVFSLLSMICNNCGYAMWHDMKVLGA